MAVEPPRLAIFDCDGTLVDSGADIVAAMTRAFADEALPAPPANAIHHIVGLSLPQAIAALAPALDAARQDRLADGYKRSFQAMRASGDIAEPLYVGIAAVLDRLRDDGWLLGVATGKSDRGLKHCLERHGLADRFVTLQTADRHPSKPHPAMIDAALDAAGVSPDRAAMIGDTSYDMEMARAAGVRAIGIDWGYHAAADLHAAGAHAVAQVPADLPALLEMDRWN